MKKLKTGVAYHGNRMPSHARADMLEISCADMDIVVHMLSHTDWERHKNVMKDIFAITEDAGLEVWVDNWGIGGAPGDKSHFLSYHPDAHMILSDGSYHPYQICLNNPDYRTFVRDWIYTVKEIGGGTIFWDEPRLPVKHTDVGRNYTCCCPRCKKIFEERFGKEMPLFIDKDVDTFRADTIVSFFSEISDYSNSLGLVNTMCIMPGNDHGIGLDTMDKLCSLPHLDSIGYDPYWLNIPNADPYEYVYTGAKSTVEIADRFGKDHNIWIQTYGNPRGREDEIIAATEAAYDAGARTILSWGYRGSESNDYHAANPERTWLYTVEGNRRIKNMERDRILEENRKKYRK